MKHQENEPGDRLNDAFQDIYWLPAAFNASQDGIVVVDRQGIIMRINKRAEFMWQTVNEKVVNRNVEILLPDAVRGAHVGLRENYHRNPTERPMGADRRLAARDLLGNEFAVLVSLVPVATPQGAAVLAYARRPDSEDSKSE